MAQVRLPVIGSVGRSQPAQPVLTGIDAMRAEFAAQSGGTTVYFGADSSQLGASARAVLQAQAGWIRRHPEYVDLLFNAPAGASADQSHGV